MSLAFGNPLELDIVKVTPSIIKVLFAAVPVVLVVPVLLVVEVVDVVPVVPVDAVVLVVDVLAVVDVEDVLAVVLVVDVLAVVAVLEVEAVVEVVAVVPVVAVEDVVVVSSLSSFSQEISNVAVLSTTNAVVKNECFMLSWFKIVRYKISPMLDYGQYANCRI